MNIPLIIDLDGSLLRTDMLHESVMGSLHHSITHLPSLPFWLMRGKAYLKQQLSLRYDFDAAALPYHHELITWLTSQKNNGRQLILCTASDQTIAKKIAEHLKLFDDVMSSDGITNLSGKAKANALLSRFGEKGFDYVGNSPTDLAVWQHARKAIIVSSNNKLLRAAKQVCEIDQQFPDNHAGTSTWAKTLRMHQWLKNLLLLVPLLAAHQLFDITAWQKLTVAFLSFSLCASAVYIANDLLDLGNDRQHPRKQKRPLASGALSIVSGVIAVPLLLASSFTMATEVNSAFTYWLLFYFLTTCVYSWKLKRIILIDCITLAMLYTLRIIAGAAAVAMPLSFWLLAFSVFLFLSLAFVKRYAELELQIIKSNERIHGRGYFTTDAPLIQTLGVTSGYASVLVLALYLNSEAVTKLYLSPEVIWGVVPVMLFWISWMWMQAHRGQMHDDPLVFAIKDKTSLLSGVFLAIILTIGAVGWKW